MYDKWLSSYSKSPLFRNIKDRDLVVMLECLRPKLVEYKKDKYIAVEGDEYDGIGILLSGEAVVSKENAAETGDN
jgi:CRP-like cAMP-binding protein